MSDPLLSVKQVAERLGIRPATLYAWLGATDRGLLVIRGQNVSIRYFQSGPKGQGKIGLEPSEVERLKSLMEVHPHPVRHRRPPTRPLATFPGIDVPLGRPG